VPLPDGNILNTYSDITDKLRVETALIDKNAALEAAEKLKTDFLANVSYQLRTPLNAIMGFAEMLDQQYFGPLNDRQREYTGSMISAGQRLVSLINDILDLSSLDAGYMTLYPERIDAGTMLTQVAGLTENWAQKQGLQVAVDMTESLSLVADERRLKQVLLNLISNAINYSREGGVITLSARREGAAAVIAVSDTGLGIPAADIARVFTPFEKINDGRSQRRSGAGLGLSLVKRIVELHGGRVAIDSREGTGTTVTVFLPQKD
jgi:signal transduction histidine kinase